MRDAEGAAWKIVGICLGYGLEPPERVKQLTELIVEVQREARLEALEDAARECSRVTGDTLACTDGEDVRDWLSERCKRGIEWLMREKK